MCCSFQSISCWLVFLQRQSIIIIFKQRFLIAFFWWLVTQHSKLCNRIWFRIVIDFPWELTKIILLYSFHRSLPHFYSFLYPQSNMKLAAAGLITLLHQSSAFAPTPFTKTYNARSNTFKHSAFDPSIIADAHHHVDTLSNFFSSILVAAIMFKK